jgi:mannose-6-phosphate isomerase-like protein (cupin superfamily)
MTSISIANAEHYTWPGVPNPVSIGKHICDGWHLHRSTSLSIIEERMPPSTAERRHFHQHATQFFYVLAGEVSIELNGEEHRLAPFNGLTVPAESPHQVFNRGAEDARFLVISHPPSHGDRITVEPGGS